MIGGIHMAMLECPECGGKVSSYANFCPHCGIPHDMMRDVIEDKKKNSKKIDVSALRREYEVTKFGSYPQGENKEIKPIEWYVLQKEKDRILLLSRYIIDSEPFGTDLFEDGATKYVSWDICSLRKWLNEDFYSQAFSDAEKAIILESNVPADKNEQYFTENGEDTQDKVFLLSTKEVRTYFPSSQDRGAQITPYAVKVKNGLEKDGFGWWWLRTAGSSRLYAASVDFYGELLLCGGIVDFPQNGIRPAIWVSIPQKQK